MSSHDIYVHLRIFSYKFFELGLAVEALSHVKKSLLIYFDPEGPADMITPASKCKWSDNSALTKIQYLNIV